MMASLDHVNWWKVTLMKEEDSRYAIRSIMWIRKDLEAEQISIVLSNLMAVMARMDKQKILMMLVYIS